MQLGRRLRCRLKYRLTGVQESDLLGVGQWGRTLLRSEQISNTEKLFHQKNHHLIGLVGRKSMPQVIIETVAQ